MRRMLICIMICKMILCCGLLLLLLLLLDLLLLFHDASHGRPPQGRGRGRVVDAVDGREGWFLEDY